MEDNLIKESKSKGFLSRDNLIKVDEKYYYLWMCELQKWLREEHNTEVYTTSSDTPDGKKYIANIKLGIIKFPLEFEWMFKYEQALEVGLQQALKLIK